MITKQIIFIHFCFFSGANRQKSCSSIEINGAGAICCDFSGPPGTDGACESGLFRLGSGDELQTSVCCSGLFSCRNSEFTGSDLRVLSCEGTAACSKASAHLAGDLSCNGLAACSGSQMNFSLGNEYPGFAFLVTFSFLASL